MNRNPLEDEFASIENEATRLAGGLSDLAQRATVYHHVFHHSGGNHVFPLIAAHGALWARGYFQFGMKLGWLLSLPHAVRPARRAAMLRSLTRFADAFREVNRRVCVDTFTHYHFTARFGQRAEAEAFVPADLLQALNLVHAARRAGRSLTDDQRRHVFHTFLVNEQHTVVGPSVQKAVAAFDWPLLRFIALRPLIRFAYFPLSSPILFRNFGDVVERVCNGLRAFDTGARVGWLRVEAALADYNILPKEFFAGGPGTPFAELRGSIHVAARVSAT